MMTGKKTIPILYAQEGFLFVEKPGGLSVHNDRNCLLNVITEQLKNDPQLRDQVRPDMSYGIHAVNRLDRDTSGVILLAVNRRDFAYFSREFDTRHVRKTYIALLHQHPVLQKEKNTVISWTWPLSKKPGGRNNPSIKGDMQPCHTSLKILDMSPHYVCVECEPHTGRKHQIRRHAKLARCPVVGDKRYGSPRSLKFLKDVRGFDRLALHAISLRILLPGEETETEVRSPQIPDEIKNLFNEDKLESPLELK